VKVNLICVLLLDVNQINTGCLCELVFVTFMVLCSTLLHYLGSV